MSNAQDHAECTLHNDEDKADADDNNDETMSNAQQEAYLESNNSKKHLFLMCFGLTEGGTLVFDLAAEPWNTIRKRDIKATRVEYADERGNSTHRRRLFPQDRKLEPHQVH